MKNEKRYSAYPCSNALYYFRELEDDDIIDDDCYLKFGSAWIKIVHDSELQGKTFKDIRLGHSSCLVIIAKRFYNCKKVQ